MRRRILRMLLGFALALVTLEAILQLGALGVWLWYPRPTPPAGATGPTRATVLCAGDSWTFGLGASTPEKAYPAQLERLLREREPETDWQVANVGVPSRNSRELLEDLPAQLAEYRPRVVVLLVGMNDPWSRPELLALDGYEATAGTGSRYRLRFRTGYLIEWALGALRTSTDEPPVDESVLPPLPTPRPQDLAPARPPDPVAASARSSGWQAYLGGDFVHAAAAFAAAVERDPGDSETWKVLAECRARLGDTNGARQCVQRLQQIFDAEPGPWTATYLVRGLQNVGDHRQAYDLARRCAASWPDQPELQAMLGTEAFQAGDVATAVAAFDRAVHSPRYVPPADRAGWWFQRATVLAAGKRQPVEAMRSVLQGYLAGHDRALALSGLRFYPGLYTQAAFEEALRRMDLEPALRKALQALGDEAFGVDRSETNRVLESHLRQAIACCRAAGARPLLCTYGLDQPPHTAVVQRLADESDVTVVPLHRTFADLLRSRPFADLFVPDGHPNDAGYAVIAEQVAGAVLAGE